VGITALPLDQDGVASGRPVCSSTYCASSASGRGKGSHGRLPPLIILKLRTLRITNLLI
jgi:hypothetical protein